MLTSQLKLLVALEKMKDAIIAFIDADAPEYELRTMVRAYNLFTNYLRLDGICQSTHFERIKRAKSIDLDYELYKHLSSKQQLKLKEFSEDVLAF